MAKQFHIGDVLSIATGMLLSPRHMEGVYDILNYMTGDNLFTHQLPRACNECQPWILRQYPMLDSQETRFDVMQLRDMLKLTEAGKESPELVIDGWLSKMALKFNEHLSIEPIPKDDHEQKDPIQELTEMCGNAEGIVVVKAN